VPKLLKVLTVLFFGLGVSNASAVIITSTDTADFALTQENFADLSAGLFQTVNLVSFSGNLQVDNLTGTLDQSHKFTEVEPLLAGVEYLKNGDENFDLIFSSQQNAFAMNYVDQGGTSTFNLDFSTAPQMWAARVS